MDMEYARRVPSISTSSSAARKRKHPEETYTDPRYAGYVQYTHGIVESESLHGSDNHSSSRTHVKRERKRRQVHEIPNTERLRDSKYNINEENVLGLDELSDTGADVGDDSFVEDPSAVLIDKFNALDSALAHLLDLVDENPAISKGPLGMVLGHRKAAFVQAMKAMQVEGTLPWLSNVKRLAKAPTSRSGQLQRQSSADSNENIRVSKRQEREGSMSRHVRESSLQPSFRKTSGSSSTASYQTGLPPPITSSFTGNTSVRSPTLSWPPPLPPIHDPALERRIFTHKSILDYNNPIANEADLHNERLEWIGDSYLGVVVSRYVFASFPKIREGPLTEIRASFVGNEALRSYAMLYDFDKRLIAGNKQNETLEKQRKPIADLFEAYIGGLLLDSPRGAEIVDSWLRELFAPKLKQLIDEYRSIKPINKAAKGQLTAMLNGRHTNFEYRWVGGGGGNEGGFHIEIYFTGYNLEKKFLGKGWGSNKNDATIRACMDAFENDKPLKQVKKAKEQWYREHPPTIQHTESVSDSGTVKRVVMV